jgi:hypothetical protein
MLEMIVAMLATSMLKLRLGSNDMRHRLAAVERRL